MTGVVVALHVAWIAAALLVPRAHIHFGLAGLSLIAAGVAFCNRDELSHDLRISLKGGLWGLLAGGIMVGGTELAFRIGTSVFPDLGGAVFALYETSPKLDGPGGASVLFIVIVGEEVIWRSLTPSVLDRRTSARWVWPLAVAAYAVAQAGLGSAVIVSLAVVCGTIWSLLRIWKLDLAAPLTAHAAWTFWFFVLFPLAPS